jgi:uncharacterized membrane protein YozB (DUF420 family)
MAIRSNWSSNDPSVPRKWEIVAPACGVGTLTAAAIAIQFFMRPDAEKLSIMAFIVIPICWVLVVGLNGWSCSIAVSMIQRRDGDARRRVIGKIFCAINLACLLIFLFSLGR